MTDKAQRLLDRHGIDVTHVTFSTGAEDSLNEPAVSETTSTVKAIVSTTQFPGFSQTTRGGEADRNVRVIVHVDVDPTATGIDVYRADEFRVDYDGDGTVDDTFVVLSVDIENNGFAFCNCEAK